MINHARTLLLGVTGPHNEQLTVPGDAYIPDYTPVTLSGGLAQAYKILFGAAPDYLGKVYRVNQYLGVLHSTEYAPYMFTFDSRITYDPTKLTVMDSGQYVTTAVGSAITFQGDWTAGGLTGRVCTRWCITAVTGDTVFVENTTTGESVTYGPATVKTLIGSTIRFAIAKQPYTVGEAWYVTNNIRPKPDLGSVLATLKSLAPTIQVDIIGNMPQAEPYATFYNLFKSHYALPYQLSGLLLAYIYRVENQRVTT